MWPCLLLKNGVCHTHLAFCSCTITIYSNAVCFHFPRKYLEFGCRLVAVGWLLWKGLCQDALPTLWGFYANCILHFPVGHLCHHCCGSLKKSFLWKFWKIFAADVTIFLCFFHHALAARCTFVNPGNFRITFAGFIIGLKLRTIWCKTTNCLI